jgi:hypothetical protein
MNKSIVISAEKLKHNLLKKKLLTENVNANLHRLNGLIDQTYKNNQDVLLARLPISFDIPDNINQKDFQVELYYNIIDILESKGYQINLKIEEDKTTIKIKWRTDDDANLLKMKKKLKDVMYN